MNLKGSAYIETLLPEEQSRLHNTLHRNEVGTDSDFVSPLCDRRNPRASRILRMKETVAAILPTGLGWLDEYEEIQKEKIGPYSIMLPYFERADTVYAYFNKDPNIHIDKLTLQLAVKMVISQFDTVGLQAIDRDAAFIAMPKGTNLGLPWLSKDKSYYPELRDRVDSLIDSDFKDYVLDPCILYWRGQPRGLDEIPKQRVVWGFSHWITVIEEMIQVPLLDHLTSFNEFSPWLGSNNVNYAITGLMDNAPVDILSVDFSGFDASVPEQLIHAAFDVIRGWFRYEDLKLIDFAELAFTRIGLFTPEGILDDRNGSVPSGSGLTNMIDTLIQRIAFNYVALRMGNEVKKHIAQGDDGVVSFKHIWDLEEVSDLMLELGLHVSADKGGVSRERVSFLQNIHAKSYRRGGLYVGVRPLFRVLNGMLSYERLRSTDEWNQYMDSLRWYQQVETAKWHPKFSEYVELLYKWDRVSRMHGPRAIISLAGGLETAKSLLNEGSFPYGKESLSGLGNFSVVRLLQEIKSGRRY